MAQIVRLNASEAQLNGDRQLVEQGNYRFLSFSMHGEAAEPEYAYILNDASGLPPQRVITSIDPADLAGGQGGSIADQQPVGSLPKLITVTGQVPFRKYAMVFEYREQAPPELPSVYLRVTPDVLHKADAEVTTLNQLNGFFTSFDVVYNGTDDRLEIAAVWWQGAQPAPGAGTPGGLKWYYPDPTTFIRPRLLCAFYGEKLEDDEPDSHRWDEHLNHVVMRKGLVRPELVVPAPIPRLASVDSLVLQRQVFTYWENDTLEPWPTKVLEFTGGILVRGPMTFSQALKAKQTVPPGYEPYRIAAKGHGRAKRFCILYAKRIQPLPRTRLVVSGPGANAPERMPPWKPKVPPGGLPQPPAPPPPPVDAREAPKFGSDRRAPRRAERLVSPPGPQVPSLFDGGNKAPPIVLFPPLELPGDILLYGGDGPPGDQPNPNLPDFGLGLPPPGYYDALDNYVFSMMYAVGARTAQLAIARAGKLVIVRTYTWAEENYLVAKPTHLFRIGSMGKQLTGMAVVAAFAENGDPTPLTVLPIGGPNGTIGLSSPNATTEANLQQTTISQLMAHIAGWPDKFDAAAVAAAAGHPGTPPQPGELTNYVLTTNSNFYLYPPGQGYTYVSTGPMVLAEALGWKLEGLRAKYQEGMQAYWFGNELAGASRAQAIPDKPEDCLQNGHIPVQARLPGYRDSMDQFGIVTRVPAAYGGNALYQLSTGGWAMSCVDLVRIMSGLDPTSSAASSLISPEQVALIRTNLVTPGSLTAFFLNNGGQATPAPSLNFAGGGWGCCCSGNIDFADTDPSGKSMVYAILLDTDDIDMVRPTTTDLAMIRQIVLNMEQVHPLGGDLFNAIP